MSDIFSFDPEVVYTIILQDNIELTGKVIEAFENGIVLKSSKSMSVHSDLHIPTDKIIYFYPHPKY